MPYLNTEGAGRMGRHNTTRPQRMDLLGYVRQESGDEKYSDTEGNLKAQGRNAPAVLLGGVYTSLKETFSVVSLFNQY